MSALVSIVMPCYNARTTLPMALASLLVQTYKNWECILVDDGSIDNPSKLIKQFNDERIRFFRFEKNQGRGIARQFALEQAHGKYLSMLDADDWLYPQKLEIQLDILESEPKLTLVSTNMAIVDGSNNLVGVRTSASRRIYNTWNRLRMPPFAHAPSMLRMSVAKQNSYDGTFLLAQDVDFLLKVLINEYYCILPDVTYAYNEPASVNLEKILLALAFTQKMFAKYKQRFPFSSRYNILKIYLKILAYTILFRCGYGNKIIAHRSLKPCPKDYNEFTKAWDDIQCLLQEMSLT